MNFSALEKLRAKLAADDPVYGLWVTLDAASVTEMAVALGLDWVVIDAEHGHLDWGDIVAHLRAAVRSDTVALVRIAEHNSSLIKRALDLGADGVVVPWIETADQLREMVSAAHYPPAGHRGIGGERATGWGHCIAEHVARADELVLVVPMIESVTAGRNIGELAAVPGVDLYFFGSADFSSSAGYAGQWEGPGVGDQILAAAAAVRAAGRHSGAIARGHEDLLLRRGQGFRMLGLGLDGALMIGALRQSLTALGRPARVTPDLTPENF